MTHERKTLVKEKGRSKSLGLIMYGGRYKI